jgi:hypothetical protein
MQKHEKGDRFMKQLLRLTALLLCAIVLVSAVSCVRDRDESIPEGMKLATAAGSDYRLYIPTAWNSNTSYGVSGGYYNLDVLSTVSVAKYEITAEMQEKIDRGEPDNFEGGKLDWFWLNYCLTSIEELSLSGSVAEFTTAPELIHEVNARRFTTSSIVNGTTLCFLQIVCELDGAFYVLSYTADKEIYEALLPDVEKILDQFVFDEPYYPDNYIKELSKDTSAPEGMKLASNDDVAYRFYVPTEWTVNRDEGVFATYWESDRSSVSIVPYSPEANSMSVAEYFTLTEEALKKLVGDGYEALGEPEKTELGGRQATVYYYTITMGQTQYKYMQVIAAYKSMLYSLTYTALPENFDAHLSDVEEMIDAFEFR